MEPPSFEEAARCGVCKCSFNTFRRRHHCRSCGRTFCNEHSSNQLALPQFSLHSSVRVCADCFNNSSKSREDNAQESPNNAVNIVDGVSRLDINPGMNQTTETIEEERPVLGIPECKCGMPLCICQTPVTMTSTDALPLPRKYTPAPTAQTSPKVKKIHTSTKNKASASKSNLGSVFNPGQAANGTMDESQIEYELNGEGLREAIKNSDLDAVTKLLSKGIDANYCDKQGMSLLHLAALFNHTDIAFMLMENGASIDHKNAQGETPLDCAPAMLQYKIRQKIEESKCDQRIDVDHIELGP